MIGIIYGSGKPNGTVLELQICVNCKKIVGETISRGENVPPELVYYKDKTTHKRFNTFPKIKHYETLLICKYCNKPVEYYPAKRRDGNGIQWKFKSCSINVED